MFVVVCSCHNGEHVSVSDAAAMKAYPGWCFEIRYFRCHDTVVPAENQNHFYIFISIITLSRSLQYFSPGLSHARFKIPQTEETWGFPEGNDVSRWPVTFWKRRILNQQLNHLCQHKYFFMRCRPCQSFRVPSRSVLIPPFVQLRNNITLWCLWIIFLFLNGKSQPRKPAIFKYTSSQVDGCKRFLILAFISGS